jgi:ketosteroid isomerase-like protein
MMVFGLQSLFVTISQASNPHQAGWRVSASSASGHAEGLGARDIMKSLLPAAALFITFLCVSTTVQAQTMQQSHLDERIQTLEDKAALKALVDTFSTLADVKDVQKQVLLFTEDAVVESVADGRPGTPLKGRKQIGEAFGAYLGLFETVYHLNGQQTVNVKGDTATGTAYCLVVLIGMEGGKRIKNTAGVRYSDTYVRSGNDWLISRRVSHFTWRDKEELMGLVQGTVSPETQGTGTKR